CPLFTLIHGPPPHPLLPYTTLFRSGARMPLIAYNVNLDTDNLEIANKIAKAIRASGGGFRYCKAIGVMLEHRHIAQVSMNLVNRSEEHTSELQSRFDLVCRLLLEKK